MPVRNVKMGNGASSKKFIVVDGEKLSVLHVEKTYPKIVAELESKTDLLTEKEKQLEERTLEVSRLREEIHKLQCVVEEKATKTVAPETISENPEEGDNNGILAEKLKNVDVNNFSRMDSKTKFLAAALTAVRNKRFAVSAESGDRKSATNLQELQKHP